MEEGDHSECSIELVACPEHREEQLRRINENRTKPTAEELNAMDGWDDLFRPMTPEERMKFEAEHRFMDQVIFVGLKNLNTGFDAQGIHHFSPADFGEVINRCEPLHIIPIGIEVFTTDGGFIEVVFALDDGSPEEDSDWARRLVQRYKEFADITMSATFRVPDSFAGRRQRPQDRVLIQAKTDGDASSGISSDPKHAEKWQVRALALENWSKRERSDVPYVEGEIGAE
jgi:hypothetical protein